MNTQSFNQILLAITLLTISLNLSAWTDHISETADQNTVCRMEPEAQCTGAVRIGEQLAGIDMHEASMTLMRLDKANLQGANLSHVILQLANLQEANLMLSNLQNAHLHAVNLHKANLMLANLQHANLLDADLTEANLRGANLSGAILMKANFSGATWTDGRVCAEGSIGKCL